MWTYKPGPPHLHSDDLHLSCSETTKFSELLLRGVLRRNVCLSYEKTQPTIDFQVPDLIPVIERKCLLRGPGKKFWNFLVRDCAFTDEAITCSGQTGSTWRLWERRFLLI